MSLVEVLSSLGPIEIPLVGRPQIGKSTLINKLAEKKLAKTGDSYSRCTTDFDNYKHPTLPLQFWDSQGIEVKVGKDEDLLIKTLNWFQKMETAIDPLRMPVALLCLQEGVVIEGCQTFIFRAIQEKMAVIIVFTKCSATENPTALANAKKSFPGAAAVCFVNSEVTPLNQDPKKRAEVAKIIAADPNHLTPQENEKIDALLLLSGSNPAFGIVELAKAINASLGEGLSKRRKLVELQKEGALNLFLRDTSVLRTQALVGVAEMASSLAKKVGFNPIPFLDQIPIKNSMESIMRMVANKFLVTISDRFVEEFVRRNKPDKVESKSSWFKFIPGIGTLIAGITSGSSAYDLALSFGGNFVDAVYRARCNSKGQKPVEEQEIMNQLRFAY